MRGTGIRLGLSHLFLIGLFPVLALWAANIQYVRVGDVWRSAAAVILLAAALFLVSRVVARNWDKAALSTSAALIVFFSYGHLYTELKGLRIGEWLVGRHRILAPAVIGLLLVVFVAILRDGRWSRGMNRVMMVVGVALVLPPLAGVIAYQIRAADASSAVPAGEELRLAAPAGNPSQSPDIYYIIVDGYGRADVLRELYGFDNAAFLTFLEERGFYVAGASRSNYGQTLLSLASSLNLEYIQDLPGAPTGASDDRLFLDERIRNSLARRSLAAIGYRFVAFETTFDETSIDDADVYYIAYREYGPLVALNAFESQVVGTSFLRFYLDLQVQASRAWSDAAIEPGYEGHRNRILYTLATLGEVAELEGDNFVFVHVLAPHAPFVFGPQGERLQHTEPFTLKDTGTYFGSAEEYSWLYRDQLSYLNQLLMTAIDEILQKSDTTPIIILQGDHGPGAYLDWNTMDERSVYERFSMLNAYLFPEDSQDLLYPGITPVNSFRALFAGHFGAETPLLEDRVYFSEGGSLYRFVDATDVGVP